MNMIKSKGISAERAISSDGRTKGWKASVDLVFSRFKAQLKRKAAFPQFLKMDDNVNLVIIREDRGSTYALIRLEELLDLVSGRSA